MYERGFDLIERMVAMLTKLTDPDRRTAPFTFTISLPFKSAATLMR